MREYLPGSKPHQVTSTPISRRQLLSAGGVLCTAAATGGFLSGCSPGGRRAIDPFTLGVASGDPLPDGVALWTRLAPDPLNGGGMPPKDVDVQWQIARDENFRHIVGRGTAIAGAHTAHSVHVDVGGLGPARWYWYRFKAGSYISPTGRTKTAHAGDSSPRRFRFAFVSCQNWQHGYYTAYGSLAEEDIDVVLHLGDYIYESGMIPNAPRVHEGGEPLTLEQYRNRHALYKTDLALQRAHASFPFIMTFDDHETENNYAALVPEKDSETPGPQAFRRRRAAAYRAYWEHLPLRASTRPTGAHMPLYRRFSLGDLVEISVLDTRQYRSDQSCLVPHPPRCVVPTQRAMTMTGPAQERWLLDGLDRSRARWNVVAQQTMLAPFDLSVGAERSFNTDQWDGYPSARARLLGFLLHRRPKNPVVLSGDLHSTWIADLKADARDPNSESIGTEFVSTSISSLSPADFNAEVAAALPENPHVGFFDGEFRGYTRCDVTPSGWRTDVKAVPTVMSPEASPFRLASFEIREGHPGARRLA
jgi:alkaline phosphatase D